MTRLVASAEALAALAARLRADVEGIALDPEIEAALDDVLAEMGVAALGDAERLGRPRPDRGASGRGSGREPGPPAGVELRRSDHPASQGRSSATIAPAFAQVPEMHAALSDDRAPSCSMSAPAWAVLSVAFCHQVPGPARGRARDVGRAANEYGGETDRGYDCRAPPDQRVEDLTDEEGYDVAWVPGPFRRSGETPHHVLARACRAESRPLHRLRPLRRPAGPAVAAARRAADDPARGGGDPPTRRLGADRRRVPRRARARTDLGNAAPVLHRRAEKVPRRLRTALLCLFVFALLASQQPGHGARRERERRFGVEGTRAFIAPSVSVLSDPARPSTSATGPT